MGTDSAEQITPFEVTVDPTDIKDLRRRLTDTLWPDQLPEASWDYGTERETLQSLCEYWCESFDWGAFESRWNRFDQFTTVIDGHHVHFYHARSPEESAQPLVLLHGWPSSVAEFHEVVGPLTDPAAYGGDSEDAFHVVAPSLPGYGFSGPTREHGVDIRAVTDTVAGLMTRLGYDRYIAQGGDWGALVAARLGADYTTQVEAIHTTMPFVAPSQFDDPMRMLDEAGKADYRETKAFREDGMGYYELQSTRPLTLAYGLTDSPAGLAGWLLEKFRSWSDCDDVIEYFGNDRLLDTISVYWLTGTINSSMRL
jgi:pimeloyl-ACP methyl ester carboxylesterase